MVQRLILRRGSQNEVEGKEGNSLSVVVDVEVPVHEDESDSGEQSVRDEERRSHVQQESVEESTRQCVVRGIPRLRDHGQGAIEEEDAVEEKAQHDPGHPRLADLDEAFVEDSVGLVDVLDHRQRLQVVERPNVHGAHPRHAQTRHEERDHRRDRGVQIVVRTALLQIVLRLLDESARYVVLQVHQDRVRNRRDDRRKHRPPRKHAVRHFRQQVAGVRAGLHRRRFVSTGANTAVAYAVQSLTASDGWQCRGRMSQGRAGYEGTSVCVVSDPTEQNR